MQNNQRHEQRNQVNFGGRGGRGRFIREKPKDKKGTLRRVIKYLGKSKNLIMLLFAILIIITIVGLFSPIIQSRVLNSVDEGKASNFRMLLTVLAG